MDTYVLQVCTLLDCGALAIGERGKILECAQLDDQQWLELHNVLPSCLHLPVYMEGNIQEDRVCCHELLVSQMFVIELKICGATCRDTSYLKGWRDASINVNDR